MKSLIHNIAHFSFIHSFFFFFFASHLHRSAIPGARSPVVGGEATDKAIVAVDDGRDRSRGEKEPRDDRVRSSGTKRSELQSIEMDKKDRSKTRSKSRGRPLAVTSVQVASLLFN
jgi:hypothetical protein